MADIQLSSQLFQDIQTAVARQVPDADAGVVMQHLAAVIGYMLGSQRGMPAEDREGFMEEICGFARHVYLDVLQQQQQEQQPQQAAPPSGDAFGYWEPGKD